jgi:cytochrome c-type biogenesis protein CcmF
MNLLIVSLLLPEFGHFLLWLSLGCCMAYGLIYLIPNTQGIRYKFMNIHVYLLLISLSTASMCLFVSLFNADFSVAYVAAHVHSVQPTIYRLTAFWGGHEGSMLLWVWILSFWMLAVKQSQKYYARANISDVILVMTIIMALMLLFIILTSNPFLRYLPLSPMEGVELNPLLQDPGLILHPPMLYMGYVGFIVTFAFSVVGLWHGRIDKKWAALMQPWCLLAWSFLTIGIVLGSWWAYRELGWGGWWYWDPVENASLMPWLTGTALIHSLQVTTRYERFRAWTSLMSILTFTLSLLGTFLVRSGLLVSVHSFANDPSRGKLLLFIISLVLGSSLCLYAYRAKNLQDQSPCILGSTESFLFANNLLLVLSAAVVLLATLYPLYSAWVDQEIISIGPSYFQKVFTPIWSMMLLMMALVTDSTWSDPIKLKENRWRYFGFIFLAVIFSCFTLELMSFPMRIQVIFGLVLGYFLIMQLGYKTYHSWQRLSRIPVMIFAHLALAFIVFGITLNIAYSSEISLVMKPKDEVSIYAGKLQLEGVNYEDKKSFFSQKGKFIFSDEYGNWTLYPELRSFKSSKTTLAKVAIAVTPWRDIYLVMGEWLDQNQWGVKVYFRPMVRWIWMGFILLAMVGFLRFFSIRVREWRE